MGLPLTDPAPAHLLPPCLVALVSAAFNSGQLHMRIAMAYLYKGSCITVLLTNWFCHSSYILALAIAGKLSVVFGSMLGWIMTCSYVGSRIPQLVKNYRRGMTTGLSLPMFVLLVLGSTTYVASIFVRWVSHMLFNSYHNGVGVRVLRGDFPGKRNTRTHTSFILDNVDATSSHSLSLRPVLSVLGSLNCTVTFTGLALAMCKKVQYRCLK